MKRDQSRARSWVAVVIAGALMTGCGDSDGSGPSGQNRPNVVLIMTDDQGYGDFGVHGNPAIDTPNLDGLAGTAVQFSSFYVSPVCAPTRASLLTGRYNYRTGVVDTYLGRTLMHPDETTVAEMLAGAGYRTGIFGKWHLGDDFPLRATDQGFETSLVLNGGGIGQPSDPPGGESYFDPMLSRNGVWEHTTGYVSDVITNGAIDFIREHQEEPFFAYLAFNAPHTPLQVPEDVYAKYRQRNLTRADFPEPGQPIGATFDPDVTARVYGMVENLDRNIGRVLETLDQLDLSERTIVIFLTDNGPQQPRYNAGLRGLKGTVYEGGIRVPLWVRWPGRLVPHTVDRIAAHIDVTPTILDLTGVTAPAGLAFDGRSLAALLRGTASEAWPDRTLFFQWHRGDTPEMNRAFAARSQRYKLVQARGNNAAPPAPDTPFELYDLVSDPFEQHDVSADQPSEVARLRAEYGEWFHAVTSGRDYSDDGIARIALGAVEEPATRLTRQDWRGPEAGWTPTSLGHWQVDVRRPGPYDVAVRFAPLNMPGTVAVSLSGTAVQQDVPAGATTTVFHHVAMTAGAGRLESWVTQGGSRIGMIDVVVTGPQSPTP